MSSMHCNPEAALAATTGGRAPALQEIGEGFIAV